MALAMLTATSMFDAPPQTGAFVGGLMAMSSTSIVVKCLESLRCVAATAPCTECLCCGCGCVSAWVCVRVPGPALPAGHKHPSAKESAQG